MRDGFIKVKGKRLLSPREPDEFKELISTIQAFVQNPDFAVTSKAECIKSACIDFTDPLLELVPEAYLDARTPSLDEIKDNAEELIRETTALAIKFPHLWNVEK